MDRANLWVKGRVSPILHKDVYMNILHVISGDLWAGAEVQAFSLIEGLSRLHGLQQHVITFNDGMLANKLSDGDACVHIVDEARHSLPSMIALCRKIIADERINIVHAHGFKENFVGGVAARLCCVSAIARTHHGKGLIGGAKRYDTIERINEKLLTDALISVSSDLRDFLVDFGLSRKKITVIHNGINPCLPAPTERISLLKKEMHLKDDDFIIGTIGRLVPIKNHEIIVQGARDVLNKKKKSKFIIVGDGPLKDSLEKMAKDLRITSQVVFTGFRKDAQDFLNIFDIFVMTSLHEGIPISLLEAMSLKKPVMATCVGGVPEIIEHNKNGVLIPSADPHAFALACLRLMEDKNLRAALSLRASQRVQNKFSLDATVDKTYELYKKVLA